MPAWAQAVKQHQRHLVPFPDVIITELRFATPGHLYARRGRFAAKAKTAVDRRQSETISM